MCEQGRIDDVVFEQGLNCGGYNVVCPPCGGFEVGCVCCGGVWRDVSTPRQFIQIKSCAKNHFRLLLNCSPLFQFGVFSLQNV